MRILYAFIFRKKGKRVELITLSSKIEDISGNADESTEKKEVNKTESPMSQIKVSKVFSFFLFS